MGGRGSGILCHITALPSPYGIGDMGAWAYRFIDFLAEAKQRYWQILPLNPTEVSHGSSPYYSPSAFAFNSLLISIDTLIDEGLLYHEDMEPIPSFPVERVDFPLVERFRGRLLQKAFERFREIGDRHDFDTFCLTHGYWLNDAVLFRALKLRFNGLVWHDWPAKYRDRENEALKSMERELAEILEKEKFLQFLFHKQWGALKAYANDRGIEILGDMPFYVVYDSADVWTYPEFFHLDEDKKPYTVAGVPPDYFSETGQLWGNPVYEWAVLRTRNYDWWTKRLVHNLALFDLLRIDHFRGFAGYWEVPAQEKDAVNGNWRKGPGEHFFHTISKDVPLSKLIAEDLGFITDDVRALVNRFQFPGMKVLLFAFDDDSGKNPYLPHHHKQNCIVYTGTHDNNTTRGWFEEELDQEAVERLSRYLGRGLNRDDIHRDMIRMAMMSVADRVIIPLQDVFGLGGEARMNRPATHKGNWEWRVDPARMTSKAFRFVLDLTEIYGRGDPGARRTAEVSREGASFSSWN
jgi:4-alpha-glucanotransferase